jgi:hypothetical protein
MSLAPQSSRGAVFAFHYRSQYVTVASSVIVSMGATNVVSHGAHTRRQEDWRRRGVGLTSQDEGYAREDGGSRGGEDSSTTCGTIAITKFRCPSLPIALLSTPMSGHVQEVPY